MKPKIVVSPSFSIKTKDLLRDLKSTLTGLLVMTAGTITTVIIDMLLKWLISVDMSDVVVYGMPIFVYIVPVVTAFLNFARKWVTETKYIEAKQ